MVVTQLVERLLGHTKIILVSYVLGVQYYGDIAMGLSDETSNRGPVTGALHRLR